MFTAVPDPLDLLLGMDVDVRPPQWCSSQSREPERCVTYGADPLRPHEYCDPFHWCQERTIGLDTEDQLCLHRVIC
eukprot:8717150-Prorocentrum_lima.AAC.1